MKKLIEQDVDRKVVDFERDCFSANGAHVFDVLEVFCFYARLAKAMISETKYLCPHVRVMGRTKLDRQIGH